jgi:transcriptional regulator with PAS, ATPase and Fis domain
MTDIRCSCKKQEGLGPIGMAVTDREYDEVHLLANDKPSSMDEYAKWLSGLSNAQIKVSYVTLSDPTEYGEIYEAAQIHIEEVKSENPDSHFVYHLSPGTPAMSSVWIMLAKSIHPAELISSSIENGVKTVLFPFEVYAEYSGKDEKTSEEVEALIQDTIIDATAFSSIKYKCDAMKILIAKAHRIAQFDLPVLIEGESGTGKELLAEAIHNSSDRKANPFIAVNCGAIPKELFESEFFGFTKGAFTGANADRPGFIEAANKGTLFLDEIGEMPLEMQVKLLRALQQKKIKKVGSDKEIKVDFRVIAATNKVLLDEIAKGNFREDLFHRIAVGVLRLLPLRERREDLSMLIDIFIANLNKKTRNSKKISVSARNLTINHSWPGNIRELENTLSRIFIWSVSDTISDKDVRDNLFPLIVNEPASDPVLDRDIEHGIDLKALVEEVEKHYLQKALKVTDVKAKAAKLLGLDNHQTLNNKLKKYNLI